MPPSQAFSVLPQPSLTLEADDGTWEMFSNGNWGSSLTSREGILWIATGGGVVALDPGSGQCKKYTVYDGLTTNTVGSIELSSNDELWVGSWENGIVRFDGTRWEQVESQGLDIVLAATNDGSIWVSDGYSEIGLGQFRNGRWRIFTTDDGLPSNEVVNAFAAPDGSLWITTGWQAEQRISQFEDNSWHTYSAADGLPNDAAMLLAISQDGLVWLLDESGISQFNGDRGTLVVPMSDIQGYVIAAATSLDGALWFSTLDWQSRTGYGVTRVSEDSRVNFSVEDGLPSDRVQAIYVDPDGAVWVGTDEGIARYDGSTWRPYTTDIATVGGKVQSISVAPDGTLWFASLGGGASRFDGVEWQAYTERDGLADNYLCASAVGTDGTAWFGTWVSGLVSRFDGTEWRSYGPSDGLITEGYVWSVTTAPDGSLWAGTDSGIAYFNGKVWRMYNAINGTTLGDVRSVAVAPNGIVWVGTYDYESGGRVARFENGSWQVYDEEDGLTAGDGVMALAVASDGTVFAGTHGGLFRLNGGTWELIPGSPGYVNDIAFALDDTIWIATEFDGVSHYDGSVWQENYRLGGGLPGLRMQDVAIDTDGSLWAGGSGGVVRLRPAGSR